MFVCETAANPKSVWQTCWGMECWASLGKRASVLKKYTLILKTELVAVLQHQPVSAAIPMYELLSVVTGSCREALIFWGLAKKLGILVFQNHHKSDVQTTNGLAIHITQHYTCECSVKGIVKFSQCSNLQHRVWLGLIFFFFHVFTFPESCQLVERWFCKVKRHCLVCLCKLAFWSVVLELECRALPVLVECKLCHACALCLGQKENKPLKTYLPHVSIWFLGEYLRHNK